MKIKAVTSGGDPNKHQVLFFEAKHGGESFKAVLHHDDVTIEQGAMHGCYTWLGQWNMKFVGLPDSVNFCSDMKELEYEFYLWAKKVLNEDVRVVFVNKFNKSEFFLSWHEWVRIEDPEHDPFVL